MDIYDDIYYTALEEEKSEKEAIALADKLTDDRAKDKFGDMCDHAKDMHEDELMRNLTNEPCLSDFNTQTLGVDMTPEHIDS